MSVTSLWKMVPNFFFFFKYGFRKNKNQPEVHLCIISAFFLLSEYLWAAQRKTWLETKLIYRMKLRHWCHLWRLEELCQDSFGEDNLLCPYIWELLLSWCCRPSHGPWTLQAQRTSPHEWTQSVFGTLLLNPETPLLSEWPGCKLDISSLKKRSFFSF